MFIKSRSSNRHGALQYAMPQMNNRMLATTCRMKEIRPKCHRSSSSNAALFLEHHGRAIKSSQYPQKPITAKTNPMQIRMEPIQRKSQSGRAGTRPNFVRLLRRSPSSRGDIFLFTVFRPASTDRPSGAAIIIKLAKVAVITEKRTYVHKFVGQIACASLLDA